MTLVLDASALLAWLTDEPGAVEVTDLLAAEPSCCSAVNAAELVDRLVRRAVAPPQQIGEVIADVAATGLQILPVDRWIGIHAGLVRAEYYDRGSRPLSMADCTCLATTVSVGGSLVSSDADLCRLAAELDIDVRPIPNSRGERPDLDPPPS